VEVDQTGIITARYGNGQSEQLGQVALARFDSPQNLLPKGDNAWTETFSSGVALLGAPATSSLGLIASKSLEQSNVQLTDELVGLIEAQRNFQANAQTIKTGDAVTQTIINIR
jgi:flagellar hook protein FlgE